MISHDRVHLAGHLTANESPGSRILTNQRPPTNTRQHFLVTRISSWTPDQGQCQDVVTVENILTSLIIHHHE